MNNYKGTKITIGDDTYEFEGTKDYNELENKPDLTIYAEKENTYTKDEVDTAIREAETTLELAIEEKVDTTTYNDKIDEIEAVLEGKANKSDIPSMDDYVDKDSYNVKMEAVDNAIATKADTETVNSRFGSVDEYLDDLRTDVDKKADASSLEDYVTEGEYTAKIEAIDNAIATKADAEETANRFSSVDDYLEQLHTEIEGKADAGSVPTKTSELENDSNFLTEHQSLDNYYTKTETDNAIQGTKTALEGEINTKVDTTTYEGKISEIEEVLGVKADRTEIPSLAGYATETWVEGKGYLTEHQKLKTINGETIVGTGDIEIKGGESIYNLNKMSQSECKTLYNELVANWNDRGKYIISYTYTSNYQTFFVVPYSKSSTYLYMNGSAGTGTQELSSLTIKLNSDGSFTISRGNASLATQTQLSEVVQRVDAVEVKVDKAPTGTNEFPLVGINETTNVEVYTNKPQGIIPPNNEIWYKTRNGGGTNIADVFMEVTDMDGHIIMFDVQYEDDGDLHKWVFSTDVGNVDIDWNRTEMISRLTDLYLPSTVNFLRYMGTGMSLNHIVFGGNNLMLEGMMEEPVIIELYYDYEDITVFIVDESADPTQVTFKVPAEKLGIYVEQYNQFNFEAMEEQTELVIKPIATVEYVNAMMGGNSVFRAFRINSDNYTTDSTFLSAIEEVLNGHNPIGNYGIYNGEYPYVCEEFIVNTDLQYVNMSFVEHSQTLHSIIRITLSKNDDVWEGTWTLQSGLVGYATESYVSDAVDTAKQGLQSDIDQKLNKDEYDGKMQSIDTSLAGKVEHNEFVERCEAIEQSYLPLSGGNLTGNLTLGSTTETSYKKFEAIRNTSGETNGAAFYVNSDGTAAFYHKSYNGSSATNDAILKFDTNGLQYAKSGSRTTTATVFKNVLLDGDLQTEDWTFELEDGSTITKTIYLK